MEIRNSSGSRESGGGGGGGAKKIKKIDVLFFCLAPPASLMVLPYWIHNVDHVHNISTSNDKQHAQQAIEQIYEELESAVLQCAQLVIKQTCQKQGPVVRRFL